MVAFLACVACLLIILSVVVRCLVVMCIVRLCVARFVMAVVCDVWVVHHVAAR